MPVTWVNWNKAEGGLQVSFCHIGTQTQGQQDANSIIYPNILKCKRFLRYVIGWHCICDKWRGRERLATLPNEISLVRLEETTPGC